MLPSQPMDTAEALRLLRADVRKSARNPARGNELCQLREAAGVSQRRIAAVLGVSNTSIGNWERDQHPGRTAKRLVLYRRAIDYLAQELKESTA
jgi:DNA-binding transcriptional regulator YiaG